jgi:hypothetical protein
MRTTAEAGKPMANVGAPVPDVALTVALTANQATPSKKSPTGEPSSAGPPLKCPTRSLRWRAQVPDVEPTPARSPGQRNTPCHAASACSKSWTRWSGVGRFGLPAVIASQPQSTIHLAALERSGGTSPFHRKYLRRRPVSACLCPPSELMNVVSGKPPLPTTLTFFSTNPQTNYAAWEHVAAKLTDATSDFDAPRWQRRRRSDRPPTVFRQGR